MMLIFWVSTSLSQQSAPKAESGPPQLKYDLPANPFGYQYLVINVQSKDEQIDQFPTLLFYKVGKTEQLVSSIGLNSTGSVIIPTSQLKDIKAIKIKQQDPKLPELAHMVNMQFVRPTLLDLDQLVQLENKQQSSKALIYKFKIDLAAKWDQLNLLSTINVNQIEQKFQIYAGYDRVASSISYDKLSIETWGYGEEVFATKKQVEKYKEIYFTVQLPPKGRARIKAKVFNNTDLQLFESWYYDWVEKDYNKTYSAILKKSKKSGYLITIHSFSGSFKLQYSSEGKQFSEVQIGKGSSFQTFLIHQDMITSESTEFKFRVSSAGICAYEIKGEYLESAQSVLRLNTKEYSILKQGESDKFLVKFAYDKDQSLTLQVESATKEKAPAVKLLLKGAEIKKSQAGQVYLTYKPTEEQCPKNECQFEVLVDGPSSYYITYRLDGETIYLQDSKAYSSYLSQDQDQQFTYILPFNGTGSVKISIHNIYGFCAFQDSRGTNLKILEYQNVKKKVQFSVIGVTECHYQLEIRATFSDNKTNVVLHEHRKPQYYSIAHSDQSKEIALEELSKTTTFVVQNINGQRTGFRFKFNNGTLTQVYFGFSKLVLDNAEKGKNVSLVIQNFQQRSIKVLVSYSSDPECVVFPNEFEISLSLIKAQQPKCVQFLTGISQELTLTFAGFHLKSTTNNKLALSVGKKETELQLTTQHSVISVKQLEENCLPAPNLCSLKVTYSFEQDSEDFKLLLHQHNNIMQLVDGVAYSVREHSAQINFLYYLNKDAEIKVILNQVVGRMSIDAEVAPLTLVDFTFPKPNQGKYRGSNSLTIPSADLSACVEAECALLLTVSQFNATGQFLIQLFQHLLTLADNMSVEDYLENDQVKIYKFVPKKVNTEYTISAYGLFGHCTFLRVFEGDVELKSDGESVVVKSIDKPKVYSVSIRGQGKCAFQVRAIETAKPIINVYANVPHNYKINSAPLTFLFTNPTELNFTAMALSQSFTFKVGILPVKGDFFNQNYTAEAQYPNNQLNSAVNKELSCQSCQYLIRVSSHMTYEVNFTFLVLLEGQPFNLHEDYTYKLIFPNNYNLYYEGDSSKIHITVIEGKPIYYWFNGENDKISPDDSKVLSTSGQNSLQLSGSDLSEATVKVTNSQSISHSLKVGYPQIFNDVDGLEVHFIAPADNIVVTVSWSEDAQVTYQFSCDKCEIQKVNSGVTRLVNTTNKNIAVSIKGKSSWVTVLASDFIVNRIFNNNEFDWVTVPNAHILLETKPQAKFIVEIFKCNGDIQIQAVDSSMKQLSTSNYQSWNRVVIESSRLAVVSSGNPYFLVATALSSSQLDLLYYRVLPQYYTQKSPSDAISGSPESGLVKIGDKWYLRISTPALTRQYSVKGLKAYLLTAQKEQALNSLAQCDPTNSMKREAQSKLIGMQVSDRMQQVDIPIEEAQPSKFYTVRLQLELQFQNESLHSTLIYNTAKGRTKISGVEVKVPAERANYLEVVLLGVLGLLLVYALLVLVKMVVCKGRGYAQMEDEKSSLHINQ